MFLTGTVKDFIVVGKRTLTTIKKPHLLMIMLSHKEGSSALDVYELIE